MGSSMGELLGRSLAVRGGRRFELTHGNTKMDGFNSPYA